MQTSVIEQFKLISDNKRYDIVSQTLLKHDESPHSPISILEWMDGLKPDMKIQNIIQCFTFDGIICRK